MIPARKAPGVSGCVANGAPETEAENLTTISSNGLANSTTSQVHVSGRGDLSLMMALKSQSD